MDYTTLLLSGDSERLVWGTSIYDLGRCRDFSLALHHIGVMSNL